MRYLMIVSGNAAWCRKAAARLLSDHDNILCIADSGCPHATRTLAAGQAHQLLGQEFQSIIYDAHDGFDADAFAVVCGTLCANGYLLLLTPPLRQWPEFDDPDYRRICSWPATSRAIKGRFLQRLSRMLQHHPAARVISREQAQQLSPLARPAPFISSGSVDQQRAIDSVIRAATGHRRRPLIMEADRGRGKSAALGQAAAALLLRPAGNCRQILVTAPSLHAVETLFEHAGKALPGFHATSGKLERGDLSLRFVAPDHLCDEHENADLLLVDEAAAIPAPLLETMLQRHARIVFSTTVHGYEGTGRGFATRFRDTLDRLTPQWRELRLSTPIRWSDNDPLERFSFDALLMDAEPAADQAFAGFNLEQLEIERIAQDALLQDEGTLRELFGLLVLAHYRTRPFDLRHLLDGANVEIVIGRYKSAIAAVAVAVREGAFDADMRGRIIGGKNRPHGHLAPQTLALHCALPQALQQRFLRIMRIAVHPAVRRRGVASALIRTLAAMATDADTICCSFGASGELLAFWRQNAFTAVRIALKREASSGAHSVLMLRPLSPVGEELLQQSRRRFGRQLPLLLSDSLRELHSDILLPLLQDTSPAATLSDADRVLLKRFAAGELPLDAVFAELIELAYWSAGSGKIAAADSRQREILFSRLLQRQSPRSIAARLRLAGQREVLQTLRQAVSLLIAG
jgi:tRNA(Met) cytidine acetyltransferase